MNSYFTLRPLTDATERDLSASFRQMAARLGSAGESAVLQFRIAEGGAETQWHVVTGKGDALMRPGATEKPDFEIITTADTWWEIARGSLAPFRAFVEGRMRVRGNVEVGTRLLQRLAPRESADDAKAG